ncbi:MAG: fluoride efflux transporter CrcB [Pseudomonadales bacterium]|nr:fluoride efflux transporter CrcB [Pseudomonadales bacterium]
MTYYLAVAAGGAMGAVSRYWLVMSINSVTALRFPWGTMTVNLLGALLIGVVYVLLMERSNPSETLRALLIAGFLGAFTTFSAFSLDALQLLLAGRLLSALAYVLSSVVLCILLTWVGIGLARALF